MSLRIQAAKAYKNAIDEAERELYHAKLKRTAVFRRLVEMGFVGFVENTVNPYPVVIDGLTIKLATDHRLLLVTHDNEYPFDNLATLGELIHNHKL